MAFLRIIKSVPVAKMKDCLEIILATTLIACRVNYSVGSNPSQTFLQPVLSESGQLLNNWQSEIQPQSFWFLTEMFAVVPPSALTKFVLASWITQILIIIICFKLILEKNNVNVSLRLVGYILISVTQIPGLGLTSGIIGVFYPTNLAFSMVCVLITAIIFQKNALIGVSAGVVTLCNPSTGLITIIVFIIPILVIKLKSRKEIISTLLPMLIISIIPIYLAVKRNLNALNLSEQERINLRLIVRMPHHYLYQGFPLAEYLNIGLWSFFILIVMKFMGKSFPYNGVNSAILILIFLMIASGFASMTRSSFFLIELRPLRLSPMITFMGFLAFLTLSQMLLSKVRSQVFSGLIASIGVLELVIHTKIFPLLNGLTAISSPILFETLILALFLIMLISSRATWSFIPFKERINSVPLVMFLMLVLFSVIHVSPDFNKSQVSAGMSEIYAEANKRSLPGDIFMIPPSWDSFSYFTKRAVIIEWAPNPFGKGEDQYIQRLSEVVGSSELFNLDNPFSMKFIDARMVPLYEKNLNESLKVLCKYNARYVVSTDPNFSNRFLRPVFSNSSGTILKVETNCI